MAEQQELFRKAEQVIPGGVNSPARSFKSVGGSPIFMHAGDGPYITDAAGHRYVDLVGSWGPLILGHRPPAVVQALQEQLERGTSFGAPTELEIDLAQEIVKRVPGVDMVRMVNSGTEATMSAVRLARGATGRHKIVKFVGNYHGHADSFLIQAGSGLATLGQPSSPGVSPATTQETLTVPYNDLSGLEQVFAQYGEEIAAVIMEPVAGNIGCIPPVSGFLTGARELTAKYGALLIFDEVMTGFRVAQGGAAQLFGVTPDLYTFGKVIGGGMPVGAFAGRRELMEQISPTGAIYQAGTLSGNPLAVQAGKATLAQLTPDFYHRLEELSARLERGLDEIIQEQGRPWTVNRVGSMMTLFFTQNKEAPKNYAEVAAADHELFARYFNHMLAQGFYLPPSGFECLFVNGAMSNELVDSFVDASRQVLRSL